MIPVAFALFALFSCRRSPHRAEILFWGGASLVALLLAFGKYFPLYSLFYKLPVVDTIRNPNKFLQVFQMALAILTAYGVDRVFQGKPEAASVKSNVEMAIVRRFFWGVTAVLGVWVLWALGTSLNQAGIAAEFSRQGWPGEMAQVIAANQVNALWHSGFMLAFTAAVFALYAFPRFRMADRFRNWIAAGLILLISADALLLSKHYVQPMPRSYIEPNALTNYLKKNLGVQRVALLTQQGINNIWLAYLLPYNRIAAFDFTQMPRIPNDYKKFLAAARKIHCACGALPPSNTCSARPPWNNNFPPDRLKRFLPMTLPQCQTMNSGSFPARTGPMRSSNCSTRFRGTRW